MPVPVTVTLRYPPLGRVSGVLTTRSTENEGLEEADPWGVVTTIAPVVAPAGELTVISVPAAFTVKPGALVPLNVTLVVPVKPEPVMVTLVPATPPLGVKLVMTGGGSSRATNASAKPALVILVAP